MESRVIIKEKRKTPQMGNLSKSCVMSIAVLPYCFVHLDSLVAHAEEEALSVQWIWVVETTTSVPFRTLIPVGRDAPCVL